MQHFKIFNTIYLAFKWLIAIILLMGFFQHSAQAGPIISATNATINSGLGFDDVDNDIANTYNQAGLYNQYHSGITDFDSYIATSPFHTSDYNNNEWFSASTATSITYDLGRLADIDAIALWNEESAGIATFDLLGSIDGSLFFSLASALLPTDNPFDENLPNADYRYLPEVFNFATANLQYVRLDISGCRGLKGPYDICSIGEVAFRATDVPEPAALALVCLGLLGLRVNKKRASSRHILQDCTS